jgi:hypothetical protein
MKKIIGIIVLSLLATLLFAEKYEIDIEKNRKTYEVVLFQTDDLPKHMGDTSITAYDEGKEWAFDNGIMVAFDELGYIRRSDSRRHNMNSPVMTSNQIDTIITVIYAVNGYSLPNNGIEEDPEWPGFRFKNDAFENLSFEDMLGKFFRYRYVFFIREKGSNNTWTEYTNEIGTSIFLDPNLTYNNVNKLLWYDWYRYDTRNFYKPIY